MPNDRPPVHGLAAELGQPVFVDNVPGAGGNNGNAPASAATLDGYTLLLGSAGPLVVHPFTYPVAGELFKKKMKVDIRELAHDGAGPARKALQAGDASVMFDPCKGAISSIRRGLEEPLAVAAPGRLVSIPEVPTFREIGMANYELRIWTGVLAPAGTPKEIVKKLNQVIQAVLQTPEMRKETADEGGESTLVKESGVPRVL